MALPVLVLLQCSKWRWCVVVHSLVNTVTVCIAPHAVLENCFQRTPVPVHMRAGFRLYGAHLVLVRFVVLSSLSAAMVL